MCLKVSALHMLSKQADISESVQFFRHANKNISSSNKTLNKRSHICPESVCVDLSVVVSAQTHALLFAGVCAHKEGFEFSFALYVYQATALT